MTTQHLSAADIWKAAYGELELQLPRETFNTWLRHSRLLAHEDGTFIIGVPNIYAREWLEHRLKKVVMRTLARVAQRSVEVRFVLAAKRTAKSEEPPIEEAGPLLAPLAEKKQPTPQFEHLAAGETGLNPRQIFDTMANGRSNQLAVAAAQAVVDSPQPQFNPLVIHSSVGQGKSHLLHAIGNAITKQGRRVLFVSAETFTNDLVAAIQHRNMPGFREKYRQTDVLLVDDIQFLAGKDSTQEEFYHTFNALFDSNAQIILSADRPPATIKRLDTRLRSRFEGGLVVEIQPPDFLTRLDILEIKAAAHGYEDRISYEIFERIAETVEGSVRELEGALNRVMASALLTNSTPSMENAEKILKHVKKESTKSAITLESIIMATAEFYNVTPKEIIGRGRARDVSTARQVVMYLAREEADIALQQIGKTLGGRNHSTVLYSYERVEALLQTDSQIRRQIQTILRSLKPTTQQDNIPKNR